MIILVSPLCFTSVFEALRSLMYMATWPIGATQMSLSFCWAYLRASSMRPMSVGE